MRLKRMAKGKQFEKNVQCSHGVVWFCHELSTFHLMLKQQALSAFLNSGRGEGLAACQTWLVSSETPSQLHCALAWGFPLFSCLYSVELLTLSLKVSSVCFFCLNMMFSDNQIWGNFKIKTMISITFDGPECPMLCYSDMKTWVACWSKKLPLKCMVCLNHWKCELGFWDGCTSGGLEKPCLHEFVSKFWEVTPTHLSIGVCNLK